MNLPPHGTDNRYCNGPCRCTDCRAAHAAVHRRRRRLVAYGQLQPGYVPGCGTRRRLRALTANGWSFRELAEHLGSSWSGVSQIARRPESTPVTPRIRTAIAALYGELADVPGSSLRAKTWAAKRGWAPPSWWPGDSIDDPDATPVQPGIGVDVSDLLDMQVRVDRAVRGCLPYGRLTHAERAVAVRRLNRAGLNDGEIARALHSSNDTIGRRRMRMGLPANSEIGSNYSRSA